MIVMNRKVVIAIIAIVALLIFFVVTRSSKETYVLPDFVAGSYASNICPEGYMLVCLSSELGGLSSTVPFPTSLPPPCHEEKFPIPLCLPQQRYVRPPTKSYYPK
jgi:hypothetical protein